jgi:hypothetical protein
MGEQLNAVVVSGIMPDPNTSPSFDRDQAILLASRVFAAFLLFWVVEDITELPHELFTVVHYFREAGVPELSPFQAMRSSYFLGDYMMYLLANILRIALWLLAAGWFYRCGPRIQNFFTAAPTMTLAMHFQDTPPKPDQDASPPGLQS